MSRKKKKRILAMFCALLVVAGSLIPGQEMVTEASDSSVKFGDTNAHLRLEKTLNAMPDTVEATVTMENAWNILPADGKAAGLTKQTGLTDIPDKTLHYAGKHVEAGNYFSFKHSFQADIPEIYSMDDLALEFWFYNPNPTVTVGTYGENQLELTSSGTNDSQEIRWYFNSSHMGFQKGWNHIYLPLNSYMAQTGVFDIASVNFIRLYGIQNTGSASADYIISDINLVVCREQANNTGVISSEDILKSKGSYLTTSGDMANGGTNDGPQVGLTMYNLSENTASHRFSTPLDFSRYGAGRLVVGFWIYSSEKITSGVLELTSSGTMDKNEVCWYFKDMGITAGKWNYVELPIASGITRTTAIDVANINYFRYHSLEQATSTKIRISDIEIFAPNEIAYPAYDTDSTIVEEYDGDVPTTARKFYQVANGLSGKVWKEAVGKNGKDLDKSTPCAMNFSDYDKEDVLLSFWYYTSGTSVGGRIELTSAATIAQSSENARIALPLNSLEKTKGWHYVEVPLNSEKITEKNHITADNIVFDMGNIDYFRTYFTTASEGTFIISDITIKLSEKAVASNESEQKIEISDYAHHEEDSVVFSNVNGDLDDGSYELFVTKNGYPTFVYGKKSYTLKKDIRTGKEVQIRVAVKEEVVSFYVDRELCAAIPVAKKAVANLKKNYCIAADAGGKLCLSLYIDDATCLRTDTNRDFLAVELGSAGKSDYNEYEWRVKNKELKTGWNDLELSFADVYRVQNNTTPDWKNINWFRIYGSVVKAVSVKAENIYVQNGNGKFFLLEDEVFQCETAGDLQPWFSKKMTKPADISDYVKNTNRMYGSIGVVSVSAEEKKLGEWKLSGEITDTSKDIPDDSGNGNTAVWYGTDTFTSKFYKNAGTLAGNGNRPEKAGYVFAGWYPETSCKSGTAYRSADDIPSSGAYAKFVDDLVLSVKAQVKINEKTNAVGDVTDIRFVTTLDSLDYRYVGFKIQINGGTVRDYETKENRTYNVYRALTYISDDSRVCSVTPSEAGGPTSLYFKACTLTGFAFQSDFDVKVTVTPYWETPDGTTVLGTAATYCVNDFRGRMSSKKRVLVASDIHLSDQAWYGVLDTVRVQKLIDDLKKEYEKQPYEALILLGDYSLDYWQSGGSYCQNGAYGSQKISNTKIFYETYLSQLQNLGIPIYMIAGNHEQYVETGKNSNIYSWYDITSQKRNGYTVCGDYLFILSDTYKVTSAPKKDTDGTYVPADVAYIQSIMERYPDKKVFLCAHYFMRDKESDAFNKLVEDERVLGLVAGHNHKSSVESYGSKKILYTGNYSYHSSYTSNATLNDAIWGYREFILEKTGVESSYIIPSFNFQVGSIQYNKKEQKGDSYVNSWK